MAIVYFGLVPLGLEHLTGPVSDGQRFQNSWAEHAVTRGKPVLQEIGEELDTRDFGFFFDESFCNPELEHGRLRAAFLSKSPASLVVPGRSYRGERYVVDALDVTTRATTRSGRLVRLDARISLLEAPRAASSLAGIAAVFGGPAITVRASLNVSVRR